MSDFETTLSTVPRRRGSVDSLVKYDATRDWKVEAV